MSKRGRPRRFAAKPCPVCGEVGGLRVVRVRTQGHIRVAYVACDCCAAAPVYVNAPGERGYWRRVRVLDCG